MYVRAGKNVPQLKRVTEIGVADDAATGDRRRTLGSAPRAIATRKWFHRGSAAEICKSRGHLKYRRDKKRIYRQYISAFNARDKRVRERAESNSSAIKARRVTDGLQ